MKLYVEIEFQDKYTGEMYPEGSTIEVSDSRGEEILADERGLVTKIIDEAPKAEKKQPKKKAGK